MNTPLFKKIMVIDDNEVDRFIAEYNIAADNLAEETVLMDSARSALLYLSSLAQKPDELPDLIFLDIQMPEINGFGFLDAYNKLPEIIKLKAAIVMLSSSLNPDDYDRAHTSEYVKRIVTKPLDKRRIDEVRAGAEMFKDAA
ncbi:MAG TPA: response regulator [Chitinophagales bacterium]|nr:response regulator [Chitinophagales bacterium]